MMSKNFDISKYYTIFKNSDGWILKKIDSEDTIFLSLDELRKHGFLPIKEKIDSSEIIPICIPIKKKKYHATK